MRARAVARSKGRRAHASWLVVLATLLTHLFSVGHMVVFSHTRCEHGELVHAGHDHAKSARGGHERGHDTATQGESVGDHDHCQASGVMPGVVATPEVCAPLTMLDESLLPWSIRDASAVRPESILSLAPKSSPPV